MVSSAVSRQADDESTMKPQLVQIARRAAAAVVRRRSPVNAHDLARQVPVSREFGFERGTPIDRHYIARFLQRHRNAIAGNVMEIGGTRYAREIGSGITKLDVLHATAGNPEATIVGDLCDPTTLPAGSIDCLICTQTLNFIFDVSRALDGIEHLLCSGGVALVTVAGISQISRYDMDRWGDYWRFTDASIRRLFSRFECEIQTFGNLPAATAFLDGLAVEDLPDRSLLEHHDADYQLVVAVAARKRGTR